MKSGLRGVLVLVALVLASALGAPPANAGAVEVAKARSTAGTSVVTRGGKSENVSSSTQFQEGDTLRVPAGATLTVEFGDQSSLTLVGPANLRFGPMSADGRRVVLGSGVISEVTVLGVALEIQAPDPYDTSFVLQNARGFARVNPGDKVVFQKLEGQYARVWRGGQSSDLGESAWLLNVRDNTVSPSSTTIHAPEAPSNEVVGAPISEQKVGPDTAKVVIGQHVIAFHPEQYFKRTPRPNGGLTLTFLSKDVEWGIVEIGFDTTLYLADGQSVTFDEYGNVTNFDGIAHIYHPLDDAIYSDEPIENAADASPSLTRVR
jgi:hypothetical protein